MTLIGEYKTSYIPLMQRLLNESFIEEEFKKHIRKHHVHPVYLTDLVYPVLFYKQPHE